MITVSQNQQFLVANFTNIYNALSKNDFLALTSVYSLNSLNGWPRVVINRTILKKVIQFYINKIE